LKPVVAGVQYNHDILVIQLQDLALLELLSKECRLQLFEFAEGPWNQIVMEAKDDATMSEGVDGLESESEVLGGVESKSSGYSRNSFELIDLLFELPYR
jgi:hypothetical protein